MADWACNHWKQKNFISKGRQHVRRADSDISDLPNITATETIAPQTEKTDLLRAVDTLPPNELQAVKLVYFQGMSLAEAAK